MYFFYKKESWQIHYNQVDMKKQIKNQQIFLQLVNLILTIDQKAHETVGFDYLPIFLTMALSANSNIYKYTSKKTKLTKIKTILFL